MFYRPQLNNGEYTKFTVPQRFMVWNLIGWPLADDASNWMRYLDRLYTFVTFAFFCCFNDAEFRYVRQNLSNMDVAINGVPVFLILVEIQIRNFHMTWHKESFKEFMKEFFDKIYISKSHHPGLYKNIQRKTLPAIVFTWLYCNSLVFHFIMSLLSMSRGQPDAIIKMTFFFDHTTTLYRYIPILAAYFWVGYIVATMLIGEANMLALTILHLNARYKMLQEDLQSVSAKLLKAENNAALAHNFRRELIKIIRRNAYLNEFAGKLERTFTFRIFINFANSSLVICVLGFILLQTGMAWESVFYVFWLIAKISESMVVGELGSTLMFTTNQLPSMYYHSNWEQILEQSKDTKANVVAMKTIVMAMELNQNPICLTGLKFFSVSITAVLKILQGAFSYLTCLMALN